MSVLGNPLNPKFNIYDIRQKCKYPPLCYDFSELREFLNRDDVR
jgi:cathepsin A (carboxypeptidase C)